MTDPVQETENVPESAQTLASIAQILNENPESGLEIVRAAFDAERERALTALRERAKDFESLKTVRLGFFGDKGSMSLANKQMRDLQNQHKGPVGKLLGQARAALTEAIEARTAELEAEREARILEEEAVDVTAASARRSLGGRHPVALMQEKLTDIFVGMGWEVADGPELESEWYNFDALNIKPDHPARDMQDTFYVEPREAHLVLRTHTSPVQMPSAELDLWHPNAKGGPQWIEWGGCGMVNPNVLRAAGIDPEIYSGFAFGMGIERTLMFRNNVPDMHDMIEGDIRFSEQFGMEI